MDVNVVYRGGPGELQSTVGMGIDSREDPYRISSQCITGGAVRGARTATLFCSRSFGNTVTRGDVLCLYVVLVLRRAPRIGLELGSRASY